MPRQKVNSASATAERSAAEFLPTRMTLGNLREASQHCRGCELYRNATQTVFGEGPATAKVMIIGEVPGDQEDREGHPFVGPAGRLLDEGLQAAGIERSEVYVTNAVKHFKWEPRGKRRLHAKPSAREITACRPWMEAELEVIQPAIVVCLGAVAAAATLGRAFRLTVQRGEIVETTPAQAALATWHPSAVLRTPDPDARHRKRDEFFADLQTAGQWIVRHGRSS